jgi:hypothetical protein
MGVELKQILPVFAEGANGEGDRARNAGVVEGPTAASPSVTRLRSPHEVLLRGAPPRRAPPPHLRFAKTGRIG